MKDYVLWVLLSFCTFSALADDTILKLYRPFGEVFDQPQAMVNQTMQGQCNKQSDLILREDAWRCLAGGKVFDPCFVKSHASVSEVICPQSPWTGNSVVITVQTPLNNAEHLALDMSTAYPWALELANGEQCQAVEANQEYDGMPIRYRCASNHVLVGHLQRCKPVWSILEKTASGVDAVAVKRAWF